MTIFSEMVIPFTLLFVSSVFCKSIEIDNKTILNIGDMNQMNLSRPDNFQKIFNVSGMEQEMNIESNEIQGMYFS